MPLRLEQLPAQLKQGLAPVYLFGGEEPLLLQECRDQVIAAARAQGFEERQLLEVERGFAWDRLGDASGAPSLFAARKILDLRLPTGKPGQAGAKALNAWAADPDPDVLLMVSCASWDAGSRKAKWAQNLEQAGVRVDIWKIRPEELPGWIQARMQRAGLRPEREAVMVLADRLEGNLLAAQQEIDKLALSRGEGDISADDVLEAVADSSRFDAFLLVERIMEGNLADGLRVASGLRRTGVPIFLVSGALIRALRTVEAYRLAMRDGQPERTVFRQLNVWQSRQPALRDAARRLNGKRLADAWSRLAEIDRQGKGRAFGDPWHSLDHLVTRLCV